MEMVEKIKLIETSATRKPSWFYHAFFYSDDIFRDMIVNGLKSRKELHKKVPFWDSGHNGKYYISLSKIMPVPIEYSAYENYKNCFSIVLSGIKPIKCLKIGSPSILANTIVPIRFAATDDEYQIYNKVTTDKYVGIRTLLLQWYNSKDRKKLVNLKNVIAIMKNEGIELPIFDYSRGSGVNIHKVDKDEFMEISDDLVDSISDDEDKKKLIFTT